MKKKKKKQPPMPKESVCGGCGIKRHDLGGSSEGQKRKAYCYHCRKTEEFTVIDS